MAYGGKGGFGGGGMNMQAMMRQAKALQDQMAKAQEELESAELTGSAGGGLVTVTLTGKKKLTAVAIKPEAVDPDDIEMLEDLIVAAFNDALGQVEELEASVMPMGAAGLM